MTAAPTVYAADVLVIGWGLAGLVAASEAVAAGKRVVIVDQEPRTNLGGQAWWSFGGVFFVDSPEQRRMGIKDSLELARQDWHGNAAFDRAEDEWPKRWAEAYLQFAAGEKRAWLRSLDVGLLPRRRLGRAGRLHRHRTRQLRAAVPHHVGHRARASSRRSRRSSSGPSSRAGHDPPPAPGLRACATPPGRSSARPATSSPPPEPRAACRRRGRSSDRSR